MTPDWSEYFLAMRQEMKLIEELANAGKPHAASEKARIVRKYAGMLKFELDRMVAKAGVE